MPETYADYDDRPRPPIVHEQDGILQLGPNLYANLDPARLPPPTPALIPGILPKVGVALLAAPPKTGKTALATALAYSVAIGAPFAGREVEAHPVLWVNYEENPAERAAVLSHMKVPAPNFWFSGRLPGLDTDAGQDALNAFVAKKAPALIVVDTLWAALEKLDVSRPKHARRAFRALAELARFQNLLFLVLHHTDAQAKRPGEHTQVEAATGTTLLLSSEAMPQRPDSRLVTLKIRGRGLGLDSRIRLISDGLLDYREPTPEDLAPPTTKFDSAEPADPTADLILSLVTKDAGTAVQLADRAKLPLGTVRCACRRLRDAGLLRACHEGGKAHVYRPRIMPTPSREYEEPKTGFSSDGGTA